MREKRNERGEGRIGLIVAIAVTAIAIFGGIRIIPARIAAYEFREHLREQARLGVVQTNDRKVHKIILDKAKQLEIPVESKDVKIRRSHNELVISVQYEQPIDLKVTTYTYRFDAEERAPLF